MMTLVQLVSDGFVGAALVFGVVAHRKGFFVMKRGAAQASDSSAEKRWPGFGQGMCAFVLALIGFSLNIGLLAARAESVATCDDVLFSAVHPGLVADAGDRPEQFARRFVRLARELSPSTGCNVRAWREAFTHASRAVVDQFRDEVRRVGTTQFWKRRELENVTVEILEAEPRGEDAWYFHWVEHVKSPSGTQLRSETYGGLVRVRPSQSDPGDLEIAEFTPKPER